MNRKDPFGNNLISEGAEAPRGLGARSRRYSMYRSDEQRRPSGCSGERSPGYFRSGPQLYLGVALLSSLALACGDDGGEGTGGGGAQTTGQVNTAAAQGNTTQTITGSKTAVSGDGLAAAYQLAGLGTSALGLVGPGGQAGPQSEGQAKQAVQTGTCDCTATQCTFVGCSDDAYPNAFTIDGTLSWGGGHVVADLTYTGSAAAATYNFQLTMDVMVTDTTIDGTVTTAGSVDTSGYGTTWESTLDMNGITFNASGCPTAGTLDVDASVDGAGSADYAATTTITFDGTGC